MAGDQADHGKHAEIQLRTVVKMVCINTGGSQAKIKPRGPKDREWSGVVWERGSPLLIARESWKAL